MTDETPASAPQKAAKRHSWVPRGVGRLAREIGPYALALGVFVISANFTLNATAAHYADELFTIALVLIRATGNPPPAPPAQT